jgi:transcription-repair coupling factor (superfamily II helicase)
MPGGELPDDAELIAWVSKLVTAIFPVPEVAAEASATA